MEALTEAKRLELDQVTEKIIGLAFKIMNTLGTGFLEKVYENALAYELRKEGLQADQQVGIKVMYETIEVGEYFADILVNKAVLVELKVVKELEDIHKAQCVNYLKATGFSVCLLINFGKPKVEVKRIVHNF